MSKSALLAPMLLALLGYHPHLRSLDELAEVVIERGGDSVAETELRAAGQRGLDALLRSPETGQSPERVHAAIDRVAGQRYGHVSGLYWYTELAAAKKEAAKTKKQILSLRMLGKLTDELSCANSRFFRTVLYADPKVAGVLREKYVLHWSSERDVPVITVDFGDGRVMRRTITGNSAHYVLNAEGGVVDVIPGLYSPAEFIAQLERAAKLNDPFLHAARGAELHSTWTRELAAAGVDLRPLARGRAPAASAIFTAATKARVEAPMIILPSELDRVSDDKVWNELIAKRPPVELAAETVALMRRENPKLDDATFEKMVARLKRSIARDSLQNEYRLHARIHERLGTVFTPPFEEINTWVYDELFATPAGDPWLGLHEDTIYTGLEDAGLFTAR